VATKHLIQLEVIVENAWWPLGVLSQFNECKKRLGATKCFFMI
jgi:hypothetical protein